MSLIVWTQPSGTSLGSFQEQTSHEINLPVQNDSATTLVIGNVGTGYPINGGSFTTTGGSGTGMTIQVFSPNGYLQAVSINNPGIGYRDGDIVTILAGGNNATVVLNITFLVTYRVISGKLPPGFRLIGNKIIGSPYEVPRPTTFSFCIRASRTTNNLTEIADRTYSITVEGQSFPNFITPAGSLALNVPTQYFVLDSSYVFYQIEAVDTFTANTSLINYFIASGEGELPPGLTLSKSGVISGVVAPAYSIVPADGNGNYDEGYYDGVAFDFGLRPSNGFDSYIYDTVTFDYSIPASAPKKLNRNYGFTVTITDGDNIAKRNFSIFVVADDYFRSDNTTIRNANGLFTADNTYLRAPVWLTGSDLGTYRANNYVTLVLDTYDTSEVFYNFDLVNADIRATTRKKLLTDNIANGYSLTIQNPSGVPQYAQWLTFDNIVNGASATHQISNVASLGNNQYRLTLAQPLQINIPDEVLFSIGTLSRMPPGLEFDQASAEVYGVIPYQPAITTDHKFTITAYRISNKSEFSRAPRVFTVRVIGEIESSITWITPSDLGTANANFISTLKVEASSTISTSTILYTVTSGRLPPGLTLNLDGEIVGKINQYPTSGRAGLTSFDNLTGVTTFDGGVTSIDRVYEVTVKAEDQLIYSATSRTFRITVDTVNQLVFSNIKTQPFLKLNQRVLWKEFINDTTVFTPSSIYRPNDPNFGLQTDLAMIIYAGLETTDAAKYISAIGLNHKKKRFQFGSVKKAAAVIPGTRTVVYEIIYIEMVDPLEPNGRRLPNSIISSPNSDYLTTDETNDFWQPGFTPKTDTAKRAKMGQDGLNTGRPDPWLSTDIEGYQISNSNPGSYFPNSITNWRERLKNWQDDNQNGFANERNYLPLWMRSIQPSGNQELDFQLAVPLCYCKPGTADDILLNIKFSRFDFKLLDYTADRYIIDAVKGETADKYLVFKNDRITV